MYVLYSEGLHGSFKLYSSAHVRERCGSASHKSCHQGHTTRERVECDSTLHLVEIGSFTSDEINTSLSSPLVIFFVKIHQLFPSILS